VAHPLAEILEQLCRPAPPPTAWEKVKSTLLWLLAIGMMLAAAVVFMVGLTTIVSLF
jgi:hypothetical protein